MRASIRLSWKVALRSAISSDILSEMKTFTARDLDRQPARVLDACDREGAIRIQRRNGRSYRLVAEQTVRRMSFEPEWIDRHLARTATLFPKPISVEQARLVDKLLAGE